MPDYTLISEHRDGGFIADTLHLMGFRTIRGSSTRGGARALLQMIRKSREANCDFGITPDGLKGPREQVQVGIIQLSKKKICRFSRRLGQPVNIGVPHHHGTIFIFPNRSQAVCLYMDRHCIPVDMDDDEALSLVQQAMNTTQHQADSFFSS